MGTRHWRRSRLEQPNRFPIHNFKPFLEFRRLVSRQTSLFIFVDQNIQTALKDAIQLSVRPKERDDRGIQRVALSRCRWRLDWCSHDHRNESYQIWRLRHQTAPLGEQNRTGLAFPIPALNTQNSALHSAFTPWTSTSWCDRNITAEPSAGVSYGSWKSPARETVFVPTFSEGIDESQFPAPYPCLPSGWVRASQPCRTR